MPQDPQQPERPGDWSESDWQGEQENLAANRLREQERKKREAAALERMVSELIASERYNMDPTNIRRNEETKAAGAMDYERQRAVKQTMAPDERSYYEQESPHWLSTDEHVERMAHRGTPLYPNRQRQSGSIKTVPERSSPEWEQLARRLEINPTRPTR
jgi:hypothetical protein